LNRPRHSYPWYDSYWLERYNSARALLRQIRPERLAEFDAALHPLRTRADFSTVHLERVFDAPTMDRVREVATQLGPADIEAHEIRDFGRFIVHNHPWFTELQATIVPLVSDAVGEPVESAYNFLSLYAGKGVCEVHLDSPQSKWTLDLCLRQNVRWPIYFSNVVPWPEGHDASDAGWSERLKGDETLTWEACTLEPDRAVVFSGSSQWHYRDPIPATANPYCDLLFFHFLPRGMSEVLQPANWARLFGVPEFQSLTSDT
jgi:hypothetical protein